MVTYWPSSTWLTRAQAADLYSRVDFAPLIEWDGDRWRPWNPTLARAVRVAIHPEGEAPCVTFR